MLLSEELLSEVVFRKLMATGSLFLGIDSSQESIPPVLHFYVLHSERERGHMY